MIITCLGDDTV